MDFLRCTQIIHESKLFSGNISKNSTTGCFAPCAETPNLDQYIPPGGFIFENSVDLEIYFTRGSGFKPHWRHCVVVLEQDALILA